MNLTNDQQQALEAARRMSRSDSAARVMILRGSAGTGKTSLVREIMQELRAGFDHLVVCAPTNKAAKVLRQKTGGDAGTIHRLLYSLAEDKEGRLIVTKSKPKPDQRVLFIVDEASMVSDRMEGADALFQGSQVLSDLLAYFRACAPDSRMIFVGDPCQLPPIGYDSSEPSPALHAEYLMAQKGVNVVVAELKEVVRQAADSYILRGATSLRNHLLYGAADYEVTPKILLGTTASIRKYLEYYRTEDESQVMKLAWTNKSVNWWNQVMRERLDLAHGPLMPGSRVLVDKGALVDGQMLAKGELGHVFEVNGPVETFADLRFLPITLMIMDEDGVVTRQHRTKALLDHLHSHKGQLWPEQEKHLRAEAMRENKKYRDSGRPEDDPYVGALRLRYAYALTCHKAQGSEYENVIVNPYLPPGDLRWLYTAVTRAKKELFTF